MKKDNDFRIVPLLKILLLVWLLIAVCVSIIFALNGQYNDTKFYSIMEMCLIIVMYLLIRKIVKDDPYYFNKTINLFTFSCYIITFIIILIIMSFNSYVVRTFTIGDIKVTFPKENGFIFGLKDDNKNIYGAKYYFDYCSIEIKKIYNNSDLPVLENIKNNEKLEQKITDEIRIGDIYNSDFTTGEATINGKSWVTNYTKVANIKYTIYYLVIDDYIYQIDTANYNDNSKVCTDKIDETFKTIKYIK